MRDTNFCRIHVQTDPRTGKVFVFAAIDNLWKGTSSQAVQNLNLMFGRDETEGLLWHARGPDHLLLLALGRRARWRPRGARARRCRPASARPASAAGIKPCGGLDVGLLVSDAPETTSAARFTRSGPPRRPCWSRASARA